MAIQDIRIKNQGFKSLQEIGIATQYFPHYTNDRLVIHRLDIVLLSFIMRGTCEHLIDDQRYKAHGPSIGITHLNQSHCIFTPDRDVDIMNIYLDLDRLCLPPLPEPLQALVPRLLPLHSKFANRLNRIQQLDLPQESLLTSVAQWLDRELNHRETGWESSVTACLRIFLTELCRTASANNIQPQDSPHPSGLRLERVRTHIDEHFRDPLTLDRLASLAGLSRTYLCRAFQAYSGKSLFTYLQERRIQSAMLRLRQTDEKVIHIAADCGFKDLSHFNRCFRRFCGRTPVAYRRRIE